ncbi:MAG: hypothetical protein M3387_00845 [Actinomycetota bacterium]|nr:hypothetical protein [Actinomycetota bacterium]
MIGDPTAVAILLGLGAFHGLNPGMGWLFAVALGLQERSKRALLQALPPIAAGHAAAVLVALLALRGLREVVSPQQVALATAALLVAFGAWRLASRRHPRWVGMRVNRRDLVLWSFLMASAHGAGLMLLPVLLATAHTVPAGDAHPVTGLVAATAVDLDGGAIAAAAVHTVAMLAAMAGAAVVVYDHVGVALLRRAWFNVDVFWAAALVAAGIFALFT